MVAILYHHTGRYASHPGSVKRRHSTLCRSVYKTAVNSDYTKLIILLCIFSFLLDNGRLYKSVSGCGRQVAPGVTGLTGFAVNKYSIGTT